MSDLSNIFQQAMTLPNSPLPQTRPLASLPVSGTIFGTTHLNPAIAPQVPAGASRPFTPGEYVTTSHGGWSSEDSLTVPHPTIPGKWTNIPSVWLVNGVPKQLTEAQSIQAARQSGLRWPEYDTPQQGDKIAGDRENVWQQVGRDNAAQIPPLWERR
jgi:hypothetical protein